MAKVSEKYLDLIRSFPLRPIRTDSELERATAVLHRLLDADTLSTPEQDYLEILGNLIEEYEVTEHPIEEVAPHEMLAGLMEANSISQVELSKVTGITVSTISELLSRQREFNVGHAERLAAYFGLKPTAFIEELKSRYRIRVDYLEDRGIAIFLCPFCNEPYEFPHEVKCVHGAIVPKVEQVVSQHFHGKNECPRAPSSIVVTALGEREARVHVKPITLTRHEVRKPNVKLTKHEFAWVSEGASRSQGRVYQYRVGGLPAGEEAWIAEFPHEGWRILRSKSGVQGEWTGHYKSADDALETLQKEFDF